MSRHAYLNADDVVIQVISGGLEGEAHDLMLRDYKILFGAVRCVRVDDDRPIFMGGTYTDGEFLPAPEPEPAPEPLPEPLPEPQLEPEI